MKQDPKPRSSFPVARTLRHMMTIHFAIDFAAVAIPSQ